MRVQVLRAERLTRSIGFKSAIARMGSGRMGMHEKGKGLGPLVNRVMLHYIHIYGQSDGRAHADITPEASRTAVPQRLTAT